MDKRIIICAVLLTILAFAYGCGCTGAATPSPTPSLAPTSSPTTVVIEPSPDASTLPESSTSPDAMASPDAAAQGSTATGASSGGITNFAEGTEVQPGDVPQVESGIKAKYENATIGRISHATRNNEQVYAVEIKSGTTTQTVYVRPDGTVVE